MVFVYNFSILVVTVYIHLLYGIVSFEDLLGLKNGREDLSE